MNAVCMSLYANRLRWNFVFRDDDLFKILVGPMRSGVTLTALMDCCHSGTILDLPYRFKADGEDDNMGKDERYDTNHFEGLDGLLFAAAAACCLMDILQCCCSMVLSDGDDYMY